MPASLFTRENAVEMAARSAKAKAERKEAARLAVETATLDPSIDYTKRRLARVRLQLDRLDQMMMEERDPQKLDRVASAIARLNEQERQLSNRSMPPVVRASGKTSKRQADPVSEPEPAPQVTSEAKPKGYDGPETG